MRLSVHRLILSLAAAAAGGASAWTTTPGGSQFARQSRSGSPLRSTAPSSSSPPQASNVVLRPNPDDPSSFDSNSVGGARVHRYARDLEDGAEYVMWYHGRGADLDSDSAGLAPLSTGRIGRATSKNGLVWEKCLKGSNSEVEGYTGVALGLNKESWWGFDTAHVGLGQVMLPMSTPAVMAEGGVYLMYYMGGSNEETPIASYVDDPDSVPDGATIKGMNLKIGVAISQDGMTWGRVEGDDPANACMAPYDASDPNTRAMASLRDEDDSLIKLEEELYCGWPEVVVAAFEGEEGAVASGIFSSKSKKPPAFFMYYSTMLKDTKEKAIACAVSEDGFAWSKRGVSLRPDGDDGLDAGGCARCAVSRAATYDEEKGIWKTADGFVMYYEGVSKEDGKHRIMAAESKDGRNWNKLGMVLDVGEGEDSWDCNGVGSPHMLRLDDGTTRIYYTGQSKDGSTAIGVAKCSGEEASSTFAREQAEFNFAL